MLFFGGGGGNGEKCIFLCDERNNDGWQRSATEFHSRLCSHLIQLGTLFE